MHKLTRHARRIRRFTVSGRRAVILSAMPLIAAGALLTAPSVSANASNAPAPHAAGVTSHPAKAAVRHVAPVSRRGYSVCPSTYLCFWVNSGFTANWGKFAGNNPSWGAYSQSECKGGTWNDCASSLYNNGEHDQALVWQNNSYKGGYTCVARGTTMYSNLANWTYSDSSASMNDSISSNDWTTDACT
jgi:hypothetical protein